MSLEGQIRDKLFKEFKPVYLELVNESHLHSHHAGTGETHFKLFLVSEAFNGLSRIKRQQRINDLLKEEWTLGLHAFTQKLLTPEEWNKEQADTFLSPPCLGGSKHDK